MTQKFGVMTYFIFLRDAPKVEKRPQFSTSLTSQTVVRSSDVFMCVGDETRLLSMVNKNDSLGDAFTFQGLIIVVLLIILHNYVFGLGAYLELINFAPTIQRYRYSSTHYAI